MLSNRIAAEPAIAQAAVRMRTNEEKTCMSWPNEN
jgi:hypothetical protein